MAGWQDAPLVSAPSGSQPAWASAPMVSAPQASGADTAADSAARGLPPLPIFAPQHTGYRAQVAAAMSGQSVRPIEKPPTGAELATDYKDFGKGAAIGIPGEIAGLPGEIEAVGRVPLSLVAPVSRQTVLPTPSQVEDAFVGPAKNENEALGRRVGEFVALPGAGKIADAVGLAPIAGAGATDAAKAAHDAGYVLPPAMASENTGTVSKVLGALSGKIKLQQAASVKNQAVTNRLAAESLGLTGEDAVTPEAIQAVRDASNQAYKDVATAVPEVTPDQTFKTTVAGLGKRISEAAKAFPGLVKNQEIEDLSDTLQNAQSFSPQAGLELVRHLRSDAAANLKAFSDPGKQALGLAQRQAADAVDDLMERNLAAAGKLDLVQAYRDARQQLARSYDVESALDPSGNVNARVLGALQKKGRPLSGQLKDIADATRAFPKATQTPGSFGGKEDFSVLDAYVAMKNPELVPGLVARPSVRGVMLSAPYQNALMRDPAAGGSAFLNSLAIPGALNQMNALRNTP